MNRHAKVHFLTAYLEYLLERGVRSENDYLGDASRFLRFLLERSGPETVEAFIQRSPSPAYRRRITRTLRTFYAFANERLALSANPLDRLSGTR